MPMSRVRRGTAACAAGLFLGVCAGPAGSQAATLSLGRVICSTGSIKISINASRAVSGSGTLSGCIDLQDRNLIAGREQITGKATTLQSGEIVTTTTDTYRFNNGATVTMSDVRTLTGTTSIAEIESGVEIAGTGVGSDTEVGTGTRSKSGTTTNVTITPTAFALVAL